MLFITIFILYVLSICYLPAIIIKMINIFYNTSEVKDLKENLRLMILVSPLWLTLTFMIPLEFYPGVILLVGIALVKTYWFDKDKIQNP